MKLIISYILAFVFIFVFISFIFTAKTSAHCNTLDDPVVTAAKKAM